MGVIPVVSPVGDRTFAGRPTVAAGPVAAVAISRRSHACSMGFPNALWLHAFPSATRVSPSPGRLLSEPIEVHARDFVRAYSRASPKGEVVLADLFKLRSGDEFVQGWIESHREEPRSQYVAGGLFRWASLILSY